MNVLIPWFKFRSCALSFDGAIASIVDGGLPMLNWFARYRLSQELLEGTRSRGQWKDSANRERNYWTASTAPAEIVWQMVIDLTNFAAWHPLISSTNAPYGQRAKPGLIYRVCSRYFPLSTRVFVERVQPGELLSIRLFPFPGLQERVTYRIVSTICGTCVLYSITLSGWLSPLAWPMMKPHAVRVAAALVQAAEQETMSPTDSRQKLARYNERLDIF